MKLTNEEILAAQPAFQALAQEKLPIMVSYRLAKLVAKLKDQTNVITQVRNALIAKWEVADDHGRVNDDSPNLPACNAEFQVLLAEEVDIAFDVVRLPVKVVTTCEKCHHNMDKDLEIEPRVLIALEKFVEVVEGGT